MNISEIQMNGNMEGSHVSGHSHTLSQNLNSMNSQNQLNCHKNNGNCEENGNVCFQENENTDHILCSQNSNIQNKLSHNNKKVSENLQKSAVRQIRK